MFFISLIADAKIAKHHNIQTQEQTKIISNETKYDSSNL
jgi:hypothetical protein